MSEHTAEDDAPIVPGDRVVPCSCHMVSGVHDERVPREDARVIPPALTAEPPAGDVELLAEALFAWNTPTDPYFVINGRAGEVSDEDPYLPIARAVLASLLLPPGLPRESEAVSDTELENRVMEALRKSLLGDRAIPSQHEQWWRNLAREAIEAARAGLMVQREAGR